MSTKNGTAVTVKPTNGVDTKQGAEKASVTLNPPKDLGEEKVQQPLQVEVKPTAEQILKRLPLLNDLKERLVTLDVRNDQLLSAQTRRTGSGETLTIKFSQGDPIVVSNPFGIAKCLDVLVEENEKLITKTKAEIEAFTF